MADKIKVSKMDAQPEESQVEKSERVRKDELLQRVRDRYKVMEDGWKDNRKLALEAMRFRAGDQWPEQIKKKREDQRRPCLVVDKGNQYVRQVVNDGRMNRPGVKVRPVDDSGDVKVAEAYMGIIRSICAASNADEALDTALDHAVGSGFGFFRVLTEYRDERSFDQDIVIRRIRNPMAVMLDPTCQAADFSDAEDGVVCDDMPKSMFKAQYPQAEATDWKTDADRYEKGWLSDQTVRVVEYFYKVQEAEPLFLLDDGASVTKSDYEKSMANGAEERKIVRRRDIQVTKVKWCRASGAEILEERDWAGRFIPIVPVIGNETDINGKVTYTGLLQPAFDALRLYNYARTAFAERVALTPKSPWLVEEQQIADFPEWETANEENHAYLKYKATSIDGNLIPAPKRVDAADIPAGFAQDMQISEHDIQAALGMFNASLGAPSNEKSGRAIMARQREADVGTFHFQDNQNRAVRYLGRILVDLIPKVMDTKRVVRMLGEDGETTEAMIDPSLSQPTAKLPGPSGKALMVFNLGAGRFDVDISAGPSYTTKRQESAEAMIEMTRANPAVWQTHGDLIVKSQDWPGAEEFAKRTKAVMPPELKAAIAQAEQEGEEGPSEEVKAIIGQANAAMAERDKQIEEMAAALEQATREAEGAKAEAATQAMEAKVKSEDVKVKAYDAVTKRLELAANAATPEIAAEIMGAALEGDGQSELVEAVMRGMESLVRAVLAPRERQMMKPDGTVLRVIDAPVSMMAPDAPMGMQ